jgi:hypothetical protein
MNKYRGFGLTSFVPDHPIAETSWGISARQPKMISAQWAARTWPLRCAARPRTDHGGHVDEQVVFDLEPIQHLPHCLVEEMSMVRGSW